MNHYHQSAIDTPTPYIDPQFTQSPISRGLETIGEFAFNALLPIFIIPALILIAVCALYDTLTQ